jgi:hypothetical protein
MVTHLLTVMRMVILKMKKSKGMDKETLIKIEEYIQALDENVGLKVETIQDIAQAINKQRGLISLITNYFEGIEGITTSSMTKMMESEAMQLLRDKWADDKDINPNPVIVPEGMVWKNPPPPPPKDRIIREGDIPPKPTIIN